MRVHGVPSFAAGARIIFPDLLMRSSWSCVHGLKKENDKACLPIAASEGTPDRRANVGASSQLMTVCMQEFMRRHRMGIREGMAKMARMGMQICVEIEKTKKQAPTYHDRATATHEESQNWKFEHLFRGPPCENADRLPRGLRR